MLQTLERLILDPITEAPPYQVVTNRPFEVTGLRTPSPEGHGVFLVEHDYPRPDATSTYATSRDSQGEARFGKPKLANRKIPIKVYVSEAQGVGAMTNLAANPAGEVKQKMNSVAHFLVTREQGTKEVPALAGEFRDKHAFDGVTPVTMMGNIGIGPVLPAAGTYVVSMFVWIPSSWNGGALELVPNEYTGSSGQETHASDMSKRDEWQRIWTKLTVAAGHLVGFWTLNCKTAPSSAATGVVYSDALQVESGSAPSPWCYGDTPGCEWNGTPNESTTTRYGSGSDRKRFVRSFYELQEKIEKLSEEGGTFKRILADGSWMVFDVVEASFSGNWEKRFNQGQEEFAFELTCRPGARLEPITLTAHEEKTLPMLRFTELNIPGNMPALGDLLIEDTQGVDRKFCAVAAASRFLDQTANAEWFYEAESRLPMGVTGKEAGAGIPSGSETNKVLASILFSTYAPLMSMRSSAGVYPTHVGAQRVLARVYRPEANSGSISLRLEYAQGDLLRWKQLEPVVLPANTLEGGWEIIDLGVIRLNLARIGSQRWEGRIAGKTSTSGGDQLMIDWIAIMPVEEFYGEAKALAVPPGTSGYQIARDTFGTTGVLTGATATLGGKWTGAGSALDFTATAAGSGIGNLYRTQTAAQLDVSSTLNDPPVANTLAATGRYCRLGTATQQDVTVEWLLASYERQGGTTRAGVFARWVSAENFVMARLVSIPMNVSSETQYANDEKLLEVWKRKAGVWTKLAGVGGFYMPGGLPQIKLHVSANGTGYATMGTGSTPVTAAWSTPDADLATGGTLATGGYGIHHTCSERTGITKGAANFYSPGLFGFTVYAGAEVLHDAVIYANRDLRIRWDGAYREAEDGSGAFSEVGTWEGDRLLIPQSGREGRPVAIGVLASREIPETGFDPQADDIRATLTIIPRVSEVPQPS